MPELPEVETIRRGLARRLEGKRLVRVVTRRADLRQAIPAGLAERLEGRRVERVDRRAKFLLLRLGHRRNEEPDDGPVLVVHLGMSGRLVIGDQRLPPPGPHDHADFSIDDGTVVRFTDPRRFGLLDVVQGKALADHALFAALGPEPLDPSFDGASLAARLHGRTAPIKAALLDQRVIAGIGNIYACEALFRAGLSPRRQAGTVAGRRAARLAGAIKDVLTEAIAAGGSTLRDYVQSSGELGYFQFSFCVYGREGESCPGCDCRSAIVRIVQSGRSTFYCAKRQR
ncbi:MAG: bifunctional DNA-formamidopyrimidine glycosylase/DNA-(apurinic or apyrimidinic site) lyase [Rhodospirillaceae bacterium]|nr:bifunctional DNA-formamidopyrimidine glycosylase/DNA-(apurinic or apyrimidinic site) lyase [Rhodospirillaceae bacterium]